MKALEVQTEGDTVIEEKQVRDIEKNCKPHLRQFNRMFNVGAAHGQEGMIAHASTSTNVPPPS